MVFSLILSLAAPSEAIQLEFHPKVGEKYRYRISLEDSKGSMIPAGVQAFTIFKVTGFKGGLYSVHQSLDRIGSAGDHRVTDWRDFKVDRYMKSQTVVKSKNAGERGGQVIDTIGGCFGTVFPFEPVHEGDQSFLPFDAETTTKEILRNFRPLKGAMTKSNGGWVVGIEKLVNSSTFLSSKLSYSFDARGPGKGKDDYLNFEFNSAQTASFDRSTGMPKTLHRITNLNVMFSGEDHKTKNIVHLDSVR